MTEKTMDELASCHTIFRYSVVTLQTGQPRPYADHFTRVRLYIEYRPHRNDGAGEWKPNESWKEPEIRELFKNLKCGFPKKDNPESWADTVVQSVTQVAPGTWEFTATAAYTG
jgi:hypothetical protein